METEEVIKKKAKTKEALQGPEGQIVMIGDRPDAAADQPQALSPPQLAKIQKFVTKIGEHLGSLEGQVAAAKADDMEGMIPTFQIRKGEEMVGRATEVRAVLQNWVDDKKAPKSRSGQLLKQLPKFVKGVEDLADKLEELVADATSEAAAGAVS